ncbi:hypothetical protein CEXT_228051, partial [Caerostris extrusa]
CYRLLMKGKDDNNTTNLNYKARFTSRCNGFCAVHRKSSKEEWLKNTTLFGQTTERSKLFGKLVIGSGLHKPRPNEYGRFSYGEKRKEV